MREKIQYKSGYKYQLAGEYTIRVRIRPDRDILTEYLTLLKSGDLIIAGGYAWDGPSGPSVDTKSFMRGSLVHDALYQLIRTGYLRPEDRLPADEELRRICLEDGMWRIRAWWVYHAVRIGGGPSASKSHIRKTITAP